MSLERSSQRLPDGSLAVKRLSDEQHRVIRNWVLKPNGAWRATESTVQALVKRGYLTDSDPHLVTEIAREYVAACEDEDKARFKLTTWKPPTP
jgi:hypothetical protein